MSGAVPASASKIGFRKVLLQMNTHINPSLDILLNKKAFICDMDGVIYHGNRLLPHVKEFV